MKFSIALALALVSSVASADVIKCTFTEPFISTSYDTATETLVAHEAVMNKKNVIKGVKFQIKYAGTFLLKTKSGKTMMELKLNNNGSDGMSDAVYPYEAAYTGSLGIGSTIYGGCTSELKPMVKSPN